MTSEKSMTALCARGKGVVEMPRESEFEKQRDLYENLMDQIADGMDRAELAADRARAAGDVLSKSSADHLQKAANLLQAANEEIDKVRGLQRQARRALERAQAARADHEARALMWQPAPLPRGTFGSTRNETDLERTLFAGVMARRFTPGGHLK
jgi:hypothetical protein